MKVRMSALKTIQPNIGQELRLNERFGVLLKKERQNAGHSVRTVARRFKISRHNLRRWEQGLSSLPAWVFYELVQSYGPDAFQRAQILDIEIQLEKYELKKRQSPIDAARPQLSRAISVRLNRVFL